MILPLLIGGGTLAWLAMRDPFVPGSTWSYQNKERWTVIANGPAGIAFRVESTGANTALMMRETLDVYRNNGWLLPADFNYATFGVPVLLLLGGAALGGRRGNPRRLTAKWARSGSKYALREARRTGYRTFAKAQAKRKSRSHRYAGKRALRYNPARSEAQRRLFGAALSVKRGQRSPRKVTAAARRLARLPERVLRKYARGGSRR